MAAKGRKGGGGGGFSWIPGLFIALVLIGGMTSGQITVPGTDGWPDFGLTDDTADTGIEFTWPDFSGGTGDDGAGTGDTSSDAATALAALDDVKVATSMATGYKRDLFGSGWGTIAGTGCDARNVSLRTAMTNVTFKPGTNDCVVLTGTLHDPYTGKTIQFQRGQDTSTAVQIDHIVPAAAAWRLGANDWSASQRKAFFNDLDNLIAVDGPTNGSKSDQTLGEWQPPNLAHECQYAIDYINVIDKYDLRMTQQDIDYARYVLPTC